MKWVGLALTMILVSPTFSLADGSHMKFVAVKKMDEGRMFLYRCNENENIVEIEQRYNPNSMVEEIRFIVNDMTDQWITAGISPDIFNHFANNACRQSTTKYIAASK